MALPLPRKSRRKAVLALGAMRCEKETMNPIYLLAAKLIR